MTRLVRLAAAGLLICCLTPGGLMAQNINSGAESFFEANQAYKNGQFQKAVDGYRKLIETGFDTGHVYFNLGNAYFRLGALGKAILYYERARLLIPRDDDLAFNLAHAKEQVVDAVGDPQSISMAKIIGLDSFNRYEVFLIFTVINILFFSLLAVRLYKKSEWSYYLSILAAIAISVCAGALVLKWYGAVADNRAVILTKEALVRAGPDTKDTVLFKIHEGTLVNFEHKEGDWILLHVSKHKRGWTESNRLELLRNEVRQIPRPRQ